MSVLLLSGTYSQSADRKIGKIYLPIMRRLSSSVLMVQGAARNTQQRYSICRSVSPPLATKCYKLSTIQTDLSVGDERGRWHIVDRRTAGQRSIQRQIITSGQVVDDV